MRMYQTQGVEVSRDWDAGRERGMYNPPLAAHCLGQKFIISAGEDDSVSVYHDRENVYVVAENHRLDYIGMERFDRKTGEREFDIFFQDGPDSEERDRIMAIESYVDKIRYMLEWDM